MEQLTTELNEFLEDKKDLNKEKVPPVKEGKEIIAEAKKNSSKASDKLASKYCRNYTKDRTRHA